MLIDVSLSTSIFITRVIISLFVISITILLPGITSVGCPLTGIVN